jgi:tetratricopeptide (TPR) repeat protein
MATGGFGGLVVGFVERERAFELADHEGGLRIRFGSLADILIGIAAAHGVFFVLAGAINIDSGRNLENTLRLLGVGVLSGMAGRGLLSGLQKKLLKHVEELGEEVKEAKQKITRIEETVRTAANKKQSYTLGELYRFQKKWMDAKYLHQDAIDLDPNYTSAYIGMAETLRDESQHIDSQMDEKRLLHQALEYCEKAIRIDEKFAPAFLARATINWLLHHDVEVLKADLEGTLKLDPSLKKFIIEEDAFGSISKNSWFVEMMQ